MVKRLRRRPLKAESRVRFSLGLPKKNPPDTRWIFFGIPTREELRLAKIGCTGMIFRKKVREKNFLQAEFVRERKRSTYERKSFLREFSRCEIGDRKI